MVLINVEWVENGIVVPCSLFAILQLINDYSYVTFAPGQFIIDHSDDDRIRVRSFIRGAVTNLVTFSMLSVVGNDAVTRTLAFQRTHPHAVATAVWRVICAHPDAFKRRLPKDPVYQHLNVILTYISPQDMKILWTFLTSPFGMILTCNVIELVGAHASYIPFLRSLYKGVNVTKMNGGRGHRMFFDAVCDSRNSAHLRMRLIRAVRAKLAPNTRVFGRALNYFSTCDPVGLVNSLHGNYLKTKNKIINKINLENEPDETFPTP